MAKLFAVVATVPNLTPNLSARRPTTRERHPFAQINPKDVTEGDSVSPDDLHRVIKNVQDNVDAATLPYRTNPLLAGELHQNLSATSGKNLVIKHGLGTPFATYSCRRSRPLTLTTPSAPFAGVELPGNLGLDVSQYLVLQMSSTGIYDIEINPG